MRGRVSQIYEEGRPVPNWRKSRKPQFDGDILLTEEYSKHQRRIVAIARLLPLSTGPDLLPPIEDARVVCVKGEIMTITGIERDEVSLKESRQSWYVEICPCA